MMDIFKPYEDMNSKIRKKFLEMLKMQNELNNKTCWLKWTQWETSEWRPIDWKLCILMESSEAINSFNWKHWKNINWWNDEQNIKIEIVDIWHFLMSYIIEKKTTFKQSWENLNDFKITVDYDSILEEINFEFYKFFDQNNWEIRYDDNWDRHSFKNHERIEKFKILILETLNSYWTQSYIRSFFDLMHENKLDFNELYNLYIVKNTLNRFRQNHWYKNWHYIKDWNWKEDNEVAINLLKENKIESSQDLYDLLEKEYKKVIY